MPVNISNSFGVNQRGLDKEWSAALSKCFVVASNMKEEVGSKNRSCTLLGGSLGTPV